MMPGIRHYSLGMIFLSGFNRTKAVDAFEALGRAAGAEVPQEPEVQEENMEDYHVQDLEPEADGDEDPQSEKAEKPEYSDKMRLTELQALAGAYGLDAQNMRTKAEVIKLLDDYFAEEDDTEAPPAFGAMDPVE